ncbi:MAG: DUF2878 domain-containing protein [Steroidobacteraceae bacterium]|nr:DUF2878 domain-containing protein [Steroidobacteraceae bacterium]
MTVLRSKPLLVKIWNFVAFEAAWLVCVLSAAAGRSTIGLAAAGAVLAIHLAMAPRRGPELRLVATACGLGLAWDSAVMATGIVSYAGAGLAPGLVPAWMVALWAMFATTMNLSLGWLKGRPWVAAAIGAVGGPLSYFAGVRLGAIETMAMPTLLVVQGVGYALLIPALAWLATRWNGFAPEAPAAARPPTK